MQNNKNKNELQEKIGELTKILKAKYRQKPENERENFAKEAMKIFKSFDILNPKYRVIITTASKIWGVISTIDKSRYLWNYDEFKNAVLFLDEFDEQKKYALNAILPDYFKVDEVFYIDFFKSLHGRVTNSNFTQKFKFDEKKFSEIKDKIIKIYNEYHLNLPIDTKIIKGDELPILINAQSRFLIFNDSKNHKLCLIPKENKELEICEKKNNDENDKTLKKLLEEIRNILKRLVGFILAWINNNKDKPVEILINDAVGVFIDQNNENGINFLRNLIQNRVFMHYGKSKFKITDINDMYQNEISMLKIEKYSVDSELARIKHYMMNKTPELLLTQMMKKLRVIGISATAYTNSVIKNFDLNYIKTYENFHEISAQEIKEMSEIYGAKNDKKFEVNFIQNIIKNSIIENENLEKIFGENYLKIKNSVNEIIDYYKTDYYSNFYLSLLQVYKEFLQNSEINSYLFLSNRYLKNMPENIVKNLANLFHYLIKNFSTDSELLKITETIKDAQEFLSKIIFEFSAENEKNYEKFMNKNGKKFIYSVYAKIGRGANLEYL